MLTIANQNQRHVRGAWGEAWVARELHRVGFRDIRRNVKPPLRGAGQLDLVAQAPDTTVWLIEVKTTADRRARGLAPLVSEAQLKRLTVSRIWWRHYGQPGSRVRVMLAWVMARGAGGRPEIVWEPLVG